MRISYKAFNEDLQAIKNSVLNLKQNDDVPTLEDWKRNKNNYFINGESVETLQKNKEFEDKNDLSEFVDNHLLKPIKSEELKKYYRALILCSFHHGGFPHAFAKVSQELINKCYKLDEAIVGQSTIKINFSWSEEDKGIQIEEINTYEEKKFFGDSNDSLVMPSDKKECLCEINSCILLNLSEAGNSDYRLDVSIKNLSIDCPDGELEPLFFKKTTLAEDFVRYFQSLLMAIKRYFDKLFKRGSVLNKEWLEAKSSFFEKSKPITSEGAESQNPGPPLASPSLAEEPLLIK